LVLFVFTVTELFPPSGFAQNLLNLPVPGTMVNLSPGFIPPLLKGLKIHPDNPFKFGFIVDMGNFKIEGEEIKKESERLIKYFLASLTVPEKEIWVNLSPYEKDRIIPEKFGTTTMGRDLLVQDYILKQLTASLIYPENDLGKVFWDKVYKKAYELYGTTNIPINTFNKVWIVPSKVVVYENHDTAFIKEARLKVMLEEDYLALSNNLNDKEIGTDKLAETDVKQLSSVSSKILKEIILPAIEKEVNEGENFANLRQIYYSLILAAWFKGTLRENILNKVYSDKGKTAGVESEDKKAKDKIYDQYIEALKKGVYDYIKEDYEQNVQKVLTRRYFSGGFVAELNGGPIYTGMERIGLSDAAAVSNSLGERSVYIEAAVPPINTSGYMKKIGVRHNDEIKLSQLHDIFEQKASEVTPGEVFPGVNARIIQYRLGRAGSYYFKSEKYDWIIVLNSRIPTVIKTAIHEEAKFHDGVEIKLSEKGWDDEHKRHVVASALQRQEFSRDEELTIFDRFELDNLRLKELRELKEEYDQVRDWYHLVLSEAKFIFPEIDIQKIQEYEHVFYNRVKKLLEMPYPEQKLISEEENLVYGIKNYLYFQLPGEKRQPQKSPSYQEVERMKRTSVKNNSPIYRMGKYEVFFDTTLEGFLNSDSGILNEKLRSLIPLALKRALSYPNGQLEKMHDKRVVMTIQQGANFLFDNPYKLGLIVLGEGFIDLYKSLYEKYQNKADTLLELMLESIFIQTFLGKGRMNLQERTTLARRNYNRFRSLAGDQFEPLKKTLEEGGYIRVDSIQKDSHEIIKTEKIIPFTEENAHKYIDQLLALEKENFPEGQQLSEQELLNTLNGKAYADGNKVYAHGAILLYNGRVAGYLTNYKVIDENAIVIDRISIAKDFQGHPSLPHLRLFRLALQEAQKEGITHVRAFVPVDFIASNKLFTKLGFKHTGDIVMNLRGALKVEFNIYNQDMMTILENIHQQIINTVAIKFGSSVRFSAPNAKYLYDNSPVAQEIYEESASILFGYKNQVDWLLLDEGQKLDDLKVALDVNIRCFVFYHALYETMKNDYPNFSPKVFFGSSVTQLNALVAAGFFRYEEMLNLSVSLSKLIQGVMTEKSEGQNIFVDIIDLDLSHLDVGIEDIEDIVARYKPFGAVIARDSTPISLSISIDHNSGKSLELKREIENLLIQKGINAKFTFLPKKPIHIHSGFYNYKVIPEIKTMLGNMGKDTDVTGEVVSMASYGIHLIKTREEAIQEIMGIFGRLEVRSAIETLEKNKICRVITIGEDQNTSNLMQKIFGIRTINILKLEDMDNLKVFGFILDSPLNDNAQIETKKKEFNTSNLSDPTNPGGIDFDPAKIEMDVQGKGMDFVPTVDPNKWEQLEFDGLDLRINTITPILPANLPVILGLETSPAVRPTSSQERSSL